MMAKTTYKFVANQAGINKALLGVQKALGKSGFFIQGLLQKKVAVDTGTHARSITSKVKDDTVYVGSNAIQAYIDAYGRKPGKFPNLDALVGRASRHGFIRGGATKTYDSLDSKSKGSVFVLARSIAKKGIKPKESYKKALNENKQLIFNFFKKAVKNELR